MGRRIYAASKAGDCCIARLGNSDANCPVNLLLQEMNFVSPQMQLHCGIERHTRPYGKNRSGASAARRGFGVGGFSQTQNLAPDFSTLAISRSASAIEAMRIFLPFPRAARSGRASNALEAVPKRLISSRKVIAPTFSHRISRSLPAVARLPAQYRLLEQERRSPFGSDLAFCAGYQAGYIFPVYGTRQEAT